VKAHRAGVLVVEDDDGVAEVVSEVLTRGGYSVERARHGAEAMVRLTAPDNGLPDLIVLDVNMPLENGVEVLRLVRRGLGRDVPVVVLTGGATPEQEEEMRVLGVSVYLSKPVSGEVLLEAVREALG
jgi:CheY-like chemotaxis protein